MMRKLAFSASMMVALAGLSACGGGGIDRDRPDEFAVARQAPLVIPPDFNLTPPAPGTAPTTSNDPSRQALEALFGGSAPRSAAERQAISAAGGAEASPGIRSDVGDPNTIVVDKASVTRDIIAAPEGDGQDARTSVPG